MDAHGFVLLLFCLTPARSLQVQATHAPKLGDHAYLGSTGEDLLIGPAWTIQGAPGTRLGSSVSMAGDVNGDGFADAIVASGGGEFIGARVDVYLGSAKGLRQNSQWTVGFSSFVSQVGTSARRAALRRSRPGAPKVTPSSGPSAIRSPQLGT